MGISKMQIALQRRTHTIAAFQRGKEGKQSFETFLLHLFIMCVLLSIKMCWKC